MAKKMVFPNQLTRCSDGSFKAWIPERFMFSFHGSRIPKILAQLEVKMRERPGPTQYQGYWLEVPGISLWLTISEAKQFAKLLSEVLAERQPGPAPVKKPTPKGRPSLKLIG